MDNYEMIIKIRAFEETILSLFEQNKLSGTTHTYIGEEATATAIMQFVTENDVVFSNHRCHGHYLAYGGPERLLLAEIMSKEEGLCHGKGGSQHIRYKNLYTNGIQGGIVPNALGVAFAQKLKGKSYNTIVFLGDGTLGQGVVYESMNIAAIYHIPMMFIIEDNAYAMSTRRKDAISGDIYKRISGFDIKTFEIESTDVDELTSFFKEVFDYINETGLPVCAIVHNYRLGAHSKGDDTRNPDEIAQHRANDPVNIVKEKIGEEKTDAIYKKYIIELSRFVEELENKNVIKIDEPKILIEKEKNSFLYEGDERCIERIQKSFYEGIKNNPEIIFYGEDIKDPYGGAFKATKGLSNVAPDQIFNMPISEASMVGMAVGMAMAGKIPVVEMMFGDFVTLGFDQLLNHAVKYGWVYDNVSIPMIIRTPMGGKRGYGPTHSQSLEKYLIGIPLLKVIALSMLHDPAVIYKRLFSSINSPTVVIENKKLYAERISKIVDNIFNIFTVKEVNHYGYSTIWLGIDPDSSPDYTVITYGGMVRDVIQASEQLMIEDEIQVDIVVLSQLAPLPVDDLKELLKKSSKIITVEEGTKTSGIGSELIAICIENGMGSVFVRIASFDCPIPNGIILENQVVPNKDTIVEKIRSTYYGK